jgi:hypothetical protein
MGKDFNDLFNEFFGKDKKPNGKSKKASDFIKDVFTNKDDSSVNREEQISKIIEALSDFTDMDDEKYMMSEKLDMELGDPDEINRYTDGHLYYEEKIWDNEDGRIIKTSVSDEPFDDGLKYEFRTEDEINMQFDLESYDEVFEINKETPNEKSLEEQLDEAIENEEYEEAARIRDLINKNKKNRKKV